MHTACYLLQLSKEHRQTGVVAWFQSCNTVYSEGFPNQITTIRWDVQASQERLAFQESPVSQVHVPTYNNGCISQFSTDANMYSVAAPLSTFEQHNALAKLTRRVVCRPHRRHRPLGCYGSHRCLQSLT